MRARMISTFRPQRLPTSTITRFVMERSLNHVAFRVVIQPYSLSRDKSCDTAGIAQSTSSHTDTSVRANLFRCSRANHATLS